MLSSGMKWYHLELSSEADVIMWDEMLSSEMKCYQLGLNIIIWSYAMLSSGAHISIWNEMLSSGMKCYHLEQML
jgi:hypothetical protein